MTLKRLARVSYRSPWATPEIATWTEHLEVMAGPCHYKPNALPRVTVLHLLHLFHSNTQLLSIGVYNQPLQFTGIYETSSLLYRYSYIRFHNTESNKRPVNCIHLFYKFLYESFFFNVEEYIRRSRQRH